MKKSGINKSVLKRLLRYAKPHAGFLLLALVRAIINVSLTLYGPILVGRAIDYVIGPDQVCCHGPCPNHFGGHDCGQRGLPMADDLLHQPRQL